MSAAHIDIEAIGEGGAELARYRTSAGERVLMGWRRADGIEVTDRPTEGRARGYVVDGGFCCPGELGAFLADYVDQAVRLDVCPMSPEAIDDVVAASDAEAIMALVEADA